jgi:hypothetical protein
MKNKRPTLLVFKCENTGRCGPVFSSGHMTRFKKARGVLADKLN